MLHRLYFFKCLLLNQLLTVISDNTEQTSPCSFSQKLGVLLKNNFFGNTHSAISTAREHTNYNPKTDQGYFEILKLKIEITSLFWLTKKISNSRDRSSVSVDFHFNIHIKFDQS